MYEHRTGRRSESPRNSCACAIYFRRLTAPDIFYFLHKRTRDTRRISPGNSCFRPANWNPARKIFYFLQERTQAPHRRAGPELHLSRHCPFAARNRARVK